MFDRPRLMKGYTRKVHTGEGNVYINITHDTEGAPREVFATRGKGGTCDAAHIDAITRLVSLALQNDAPPEAIVEQLTGIVCHPAYDTRKVGSLADAIALALGEDVERMHSARDVEEPLEEEEFVLRENVTKTAAARIIREPVVDEDPIDAEGGDGNLCPDCGQMAFIPSGGCDYCFNCGYSQC
ncbi:hypothetical protein CMI37_34875 [Candidatus Pacearchaeota archaeon]|nr:hypothetical protein [Candidatus Pacearchaeota archaeon]|tara:strand:- start:2489 stop:3040 length:552 start_codon:yes stop_codon:yes gene_type:complete